ncbi:MAG: type III pantothenate kinase [Lachnospiraceae bacterium]
MILVVDIGNTNIVLGVFDNDDTLTATFRMTTQKRSSDEYGVLMCDMLKLKNIAYDNFEAVVVSSVVPSVMYSMESAIIKYFGIKPFIIGPGTRTGIRLAIENPKEMGPDRIADAAAAYTIYGGPVLVLDFGTATTYDLVSADGSLVAGVTAPGINLCALALGEGTAMLPDVKIQKPDSILAKNTVTSIQAGLVYGQIGQAEYIIRNMIAEAGIENVKVVATGGLGKMIADSTVSIDVYDPTLTLEGLKIIWRKNANRKC